jgi:hypothetical protein
MRAWDRMDILPHPSRAFPLIFLNSRGRLLAALLLKAFQAFSFGTSSEMILAK